MKSKQSVNELAPMWVPKCTMCEIKKDLSPTVPVECRGTQKDYQGCTRFKLVQKANK